MIDGVNSHKYSSSPSDSYFAEKGGVFIALCLPSLLTWAYFVALEGQKSQFQQITYLICKGVQFSFPLLWVKFALHRGFRGEKSRTFGIPESVSFGLYALIVILITYFFWVKPQGYFDPLMQILHRKLFQYGIDNEKKYFILAAFYFIFHAFLEEYYWRWFVFGELTHIITFSKALLISSVGFMAHHFILLTVFFPDSFWIPFLFSFLAGLGGAFWAWLYFRSHSLLGPWLSHSLVDAAIFIIGYDLIKNTPPHI